MILNRRTMLGGIGATALLPTAPVHAVAVEAPVVAPPIAPAIPALEPWWGYSYGEELWQGPFASREAAIKAAREDWYHDKSDLEAVTALCHPKLLHHPDYRETIVEWLCCKERDETLAVALNESFQGSNEENDFEGEVEEEGARVDWASLADEFMRLLDEAIARTGFFLAEPVRSGMFDGDEAILSALETDAVFAAALKAAEARWPYSEGLLTASNMVDLTDEEPVPTLAAS